MRPPENVLVIPDLHVRKKRGGHDQRSIDAVLKYASDHCWSHVVFLGDVVDHNSISHHNRANLKSIESERIFSDYEAANGLLDDFQQATSRNGGDPEFVIIEGNHDYRTTALVNAQPQLAGMIETKHGLKLAERGWLWVPFWSKGKTYDLGKATFGHGRYTNQHHALKNAMRYGRNFYYGHCHSFQSHTMERDGRSQYEAASLGCLCDLEQSYMQGSPSSWQQGFCVFRFTPTGMFNRFEVRLFGHSFTSPEGVFYRG